MERLGGWTGGRGGGQNTRIDGRPAILLRSGGDILGAYKKVKTPQELERFCRRYFRAIRVQEEQYRLVQVGMSNKGKPIYEREPITRRNYKGEDVPILLEKWLRPPTLEGLCGSIPISMDTWERYAKLPGYDEVCEKAKNICKTALIERGLDGTVNAQVAMFVLENGYNMHKEVTVHGTGTIEDYLATLDEEQVM